MIVAALRQCRFLPASGPPEMASERMRILIRKFEVSSTGVSSRCLAGLESPEMLSDCSQNHFEEKCYGFFSFLPLVRLVRPECPGEPRNAPRLQPEPCWKKCYGFFVPSPRWSAWSGLSALESLETQTAAGAEPFLEKCYGFVFFPPSGPPGKSKRTFS